MYTSWNPTYQLLITCFFLLNWLVNSLTFFFNCIYTALFALLLASMGIYLTVHSECLKNLPFANATWLLLTAHIECLKLKLLFFFVDFIISVFYKCYNFFFSLALHAFSSFAIELFINPMVSLQAYNFSHPCVHKSLCFLSSCYVN